MEAIERASRARIVALQGRLLRAQVRNAWKNVPFYRKRWEAAGVRPKDIRTPADIVKLPFVTKEDFEQDLAENPPFGSYQGNANPVRIHASSGTTGAPKPFFHTQSDLDWIAKLSARSTVDIRRSCWPTRGGACQACKTPKTWWSRRSSKPCARSHGSGRAVRLTSGCSTSPRT